MVYAPPVDVVNLNQSATSVDNAILAFTGTPTDIDLALFLLLLDSYSSDPLSVIVTDFEVVQLLASFTQTVNVPPPYKPENVPEDWYCPLSNLYW